MCIQDAAVAAYIADISAWRLAMNWFCCSASSAVRQWISIDAVDHFALSRQYAVSFVDNEVACLLKSLYLVTASTLKSINNLWGSSEVVFNALGDIPNSDFIRVSVGNYIFQKEQALP